MSKTSNKAIAIIANAPETKVSQYIVDSRKVDKAEQKLACIEWQVKAIEKKPTLSPSEKLELEKQKLALDMANFELAFEKAKFAKPANAIKVLREVTKAKTKICKAYTKVVKNEWKEETLKEVKVTFARTAKDIEMDLDSEVAKGLQAYFAKKYTVPAKV